MTGFLVPNGDAVADMLGMLFGGDVDIKKIDSPPKSGVFCGSFVDDSNGLVSLCLADPEFVGYSGAALTMMPAESAKEMIDEKDFSKRLLENFYEVMNVCSRFFMSDSSPHLRLQAMHNAAETAAKITELGAPRLSVGFEVKVPKYGSGQLHFLTK